LRVLFYTALKGLVVSFEKLLRISEANAESQHMVTFCIYQRFDMICLPHVHCC
jgi:hypothetical protein